MLSAWQVADDAVDGQISGLSHLRIDSEMSCVQVDMDTGEVAGVFQTVQPSDTDMGSKQPKEVKVQGLWYGQLG